MNCPSCNGQCYREEWKSPSIETVAGSRILCGPWRCEDCGWYEGWEADAKIDADRDIEQEEQS